MENSDKAKTEEEITAALKSTAEQIVANIQGKPAEQTPALTNDTIVKIKELIENVKQSEFQKTVTDTANKTTFAIEEIIETKLGSEIVEDILNTTAQGIINSVKKKDINDTKEIMPLFIQALYGVVIGVGSLKFIGSIKELSFYNYLPDTNRSGELSNGSVSIGELLFKFIFFGFTVLIVAHDWYTYNKNEKKKGEEEKKEEDNFWPYIPQLGSLFFLAQMLFSASNNEMFSWFFWGLCYTIFNWWHSSYLKGVYKKMVRKAYWVHFCICVIGGVILFFSRENFNYLWWAQITILFLVMGIVTRLWYLREIANNEKEISFKNFLAKEPKHWLTFFIITVIAISIIYLAFPKQYQNNNKGLTKEDVKNIIDSAFIKLGPKIDSAVNAINNVKYSAEKMLREDVEKLDKEIEKLTHLRRPEIPPNLLDNLNSRLDKISLEQNTLFNNQKDLLSSQFEYLNIKSDTIHNDVKDLIAENNRLANLLQHAYTSEMNSILSRITDNFEKLKKRLKKKSAISSADIERLQNRIDSLKNFGKNSIK